jgi:hypothetical protein
VGKNEKKRKKRKKLNTMSASERQQWQTGYSDPKLIRAAMNNHSGGAQKGERDRLKWDGQNPRRPVQGGIAQPGGSRGPLPA